jgi:hypothetical protein
VKSKKRNASLLSYSPVIFCPEFPMTIACTLFFLFLGRDRAKRSVAGIKNVQCGPMGWLYWERNLMLNLTTWAPSPGPMEQMRKQTPESCTFLYVPVSTHRERKREREREMERERERERERLAMSMWRVRGVRREGTRGQSRSRKARAKEKRGQAAPFIVS